MFCYCNFKKVTFFPLIFGKFYCISEVDGLRIMLSLCMIHCYPRFHWSQKYLCKVNLWIYLISQTAKRVWVYWWDARSIYIANIKINKKHMLTLLIFEVNIERLCTIWLSLIHETGLKMPKDYHVSLSIRSAAFI